MSHFFNIKDFKIVKCLFYKGSCNNKAIKAHSVQNKRVLELLASKNNHVINIEIKFNKDTTPEFIFKPISRHKATTFTGLCQTHDTKLFKAIDQGSIEIKNIEQYFLFAYRAVLKELHSNLSTAYQYQSTYIEIENPTENQKEPQAAGIAAITHLVNSMETYEYKSRYDLIHEKQQFKNLKHYSFILENQIPTIAVSSLYSVDNMTNSEGETLRIVINILPTSKNKTIVIFSWLPHESKSAKIHLNNIIESAGELRKYEISKLILRYCENFVISPSYFEAWSDEKKEKVIEYFERNLVELWDIEDPDLILF